MTGNPRLERAMKVLTARKIKTEKRLYFRIDVQLLEQVPPKSLGIGLYFLSRGSRPEGKLPTGDKAKKGFPLSEPALVALRSVMATGKFKSQRDAVETALLWVSEQGPHVRQTRF